MPQPRCLVPDAAQPLAAHVKALKGIVLHRGSNRMTKDRKGKRGQASVTAAGMWLGRECGLTVWWDSGLPWRGMDQSGVNVSRAWQGTLRRRHVAVLVEIRRLNIKWLPK